MQFVSLFFIVFYLSSCMTQKKNVQKSDDHHKIAIGLLKNCDKPRALSHLLKAVQLNPKDFIIRNTLAAIYYSMKEYEKAVLEYKRILKIKPELTEARVSLARVYVDLNQLDQALKQIEIAEKDITYTGYLKLIVYKALAQYKGNRYIKAKRNFNEALSIPRGKTCFNYIHLGRTEIALGNLEEAEQLLKKAVLKCKKDQPFCGAPQYEEHLVLGRLYVKKGDKKRAKYHLKLFLKKANEEEKIKKAKQLLKAIS
ncbi:MAG: tetratricopeptide repeat protein [Oligoflexia bacterium]|nr:tetratricopeptide repeat protein [Oligoflexia bacterium]